MSSAKMKYFGQRSLIRAQAMPIASSREVARNRMRAMKVRYANVYSLRVDRYLIVTFGRMCLNKLRESAITGANRSDGCTLCTCANFFAVCHFRKKLVAYVTKEARPLGCFGKQRELVGTRSSERDPALLCGLYVMREPTFSLFAITNMGKVSDFTKFARTYFSQTCCHSFLWF